MILWLKKTPPPVFETAFSYQYCRKKTKALTGASVLEVDPEKTIGQILPLLKGERFLVVTFPETVVSKEAYHLLLKAVRPGLLVGPVFNDTDFSWQRASLEVPYLDAFTFEEVAQNLAQQKTSVQDVDQIDPACFACHLKDLLRFPQKRLSELPFENFSYQVVPGALVHVFRHPFAAQRKDLLKLFPKGIKRLLDVGCAEGGLGRLLREERPDLILEGVEPNPVLAEKAKPFYHRIYLNTLEKAPLPQNFYEVVNLGDVFEHLFDPWEALLKIRSLLVPGGYFTGSIPNVSHWSIVRQLLSGQFEYLPLGLLCVTHVRFFTLASFSALLSEAGFTLEYYERISPPPTPYGQKLIEKLVSQGLGNKEELLTAEILFRAKKV